jgi:hypothetical protein
VSHSQATIHTNILELLYNVVSFNYFVSYLISSLSISQQPDLKYLEETTIAF